jgi:hypothetical protein
MRNQNWIRGLNSSIVTFSEKPFEGKRFGVESLSLTHSVAPSPALQDGAKKPCSGSTLSLWPDPRPESRRVDFVYISRKFPFGPGFFTGKPRNIYTATLRILDRNISIL